MILQFKPKTGLPKDMEERIHEFAEEYVAILTEACIRHAGTNTEKYEEATDLVVEELNKALEEALDKL